MGCYVVIIYKLTECRVAEALAECLWLCKVGMGEGCIIVLKDGTPTDTLRFGKTTETTMSLT